MPFQEGQELQQKGEYEAAIAKYKSVVTTYSDSLYASKAKDAIAECYYKWGLKFQENKQYEAAMEKYQTLLNQDPNSSFASLAKKAMYEFPYGIGDTVVGEDWKIKVLSVDRKDIITIPFVGYIPPSEEGEVLLCVKVNLESVSAINETTCLNFQTYLNNKTDFPITNGGKEDTPIGATLGDSFYTGLPLAARCWGQGKIILKETIVYSVPKGVKGYKLKFKDFPSINLEQKGIFC